MSLHIETLKLIGETAKIAGKSAGNDAIMITEPSATDTDQMNKSAIPNFASSLVHRYFNKNQTNDTKTDVPNANESPKSKILSITYYNI